jgi:hypothetical protein
MFLKKVYGNRILRWVLPKAKGGGRFFLKEFIE